MKKFFKKRQMKKKTVQIFWCNSNITAAVYNSSLIQITVIQSI